MEKDLYGVKVTLKDIANYAEVSSATVSLVLNNKGNISPETRDRVLKAIRHFDYNKNHGAASQQRTIKFLRIAKHGQVINRDHDVFIADYLDGLTSGAQELDYKLEVVSFAHTSVADIIASALQEPSISGAIVLATELNRDDMLLFSTTTIPIVFIDTYNEYLPFDFVDMDNKSSIYKAFIYLKELGFPEIGFVASYSDISNFRIRENAYKESISYYPDMTPDIISVESTFHGAYRDMNAYLEEHKKLTHKAYICSNDIMALGTMKALKEHGFRIPEDVSLLGFDNLPQSAQADPPLSTIEVSKRDIASLAVKQLHNRIEAPGSPTVRSLVGGALILRESIRR